LNFYNATNQIMNKHSSKTKYIAYFLFGTALSIVFCSQFLNCTSKPVPFEKQYIGTQLCASCHEEEMKDWTNSHHDLSMQIADSKTILSDFENAKFESNGVVSKFYKKEGKYFVNTEGPDSLFHDYEIKYTFGLTPLQQYMVEFPGGRLQCLLVAWDDIENKWFDLQAEERLEPDDWMHWSGGSMTWNTMCADCHSTYLQKNYFEPSDSFDTKWTIINVSCEACHGPGLEHQKYIKSSSYLRGEKIKGSFMYLTGDIDNKQHVDECARCHARRSQFSKWYDHSGVFMDHYLPEILRPALYFPDGQILDEVYVYSSFLQSKMYRNNVRCTDCHNAHSLKLKFDGNKLCNQCHEPAKYDTKAHHFHDPEQEGASCIKCHMPGRIYMGNDYRRDHSFRVPRPDLSVKYESPNSCNECHEDKTPNWAADWVVKWYGPERLPHYSDALAAVRAGDFSAIPDLIKMTGDTSQPEIVQATAIFLIGELNTPETKQAVFQALKHKHPLVRYSAVSAMEYYSDEEKLRFLPPMLSDSVLTVRTQTAYIMSSVPDQLLPENVKNNFEIAENEFNEVLAMQADFPGGRLLKGQYLHKKKEFDGAEVSYRNTIEMDPYLPQPYFNLANLYYQQGKLKEAVKEFQNVIRLQPSYGEAYYSLGLLHAEMNEMEKAKNSLQKATELTGNPRHYYNLGLVYQNLYDNTETEAAFKKGLEINPFSEPNLYALAILYLQQNQRLKAKKVIEKLIKINPGSNNYIQLLSQTN